MTDAPEYDFTKCACPPGKRTAREELEFHFAYESGPEVSIFFQALVDRALDEHAHRLGDHLRALIGPESYPGESDHIKRYVTGWTHASDQVRRGLPTEDGEYDR